jgi:hypothetical protein
MYKIRAKDKFRLPIAVTGIRFNSESDCLGFASNINFGCLGIRFVLSTVANVAVGLFCFVGMSLIESSRLHSNS